MKLPNFENAVIEIEKIRDYCLNLEHPTGKNKAKVFRSVLGLSNEHAEWLREQIRKGIGHSVAEERKSDKYGKRYTVHLKIRNLDKEAEIITGWIVKQDEIIPRLTTCYINI